MSPTTTFSMCRSGALSLITHSLPRQTVPCAAVRHAQNISYAQLSHRFSTCVNTSIAAGPTPFLRPPPPGSVITPGNTLIPAGPPRPPTPLHLHIPCPPPVLHALLF